MNKKLELNNYLNWLQEKGLSQQTIRIYLNSLKKLDLNKLNQASIWQYFRENSAKLEPNTLKVQKCALVSYSRFQNLSINWEKIANIIPRLQPKFFTTINQEELEKLKKVRFEESQELYKRNNLIFDFLFYSGVRVNELVNIKHCDWNGKTLRIHGKGNKVRFVFLPAFLIKNFQSDSLDFLFISYTGKPLLTNRINFIISQRAKLADFKKIITPHTFRRSFATLLDRNGTRLTTIQKLLGHCKLETTVQYIHNDYETLYQDYSKLWINKPVNSSLVY